MALTLISATPSPYARKNRIALIEKGIPFTLQSEIPWHSTTETPKYNPLEKLPILIFPEEEKKAPIYESWFIQEYIVQKYKDKVIAHTLYSVLEPKKSTADILPRKGPSLMPETLDDQLLARQVQVVADGACDALVSGSDKEYQSTCALG